MSLSRRSVPYFNYSALFQSREAEYLDAMLPVLRRGAFILQEECVRFEKNLAKMLGVRHALGVGNCTDGLLIALLASGVRAGDEVIVSSHTFIASAAAIHWAGAVPVPVDCGDDHMMSPASAERAITPRTRAIMPVHINGRTCAMDALMDLADRHRLIVVEDAAQALGARFKGRVAGTFGAAAAYSFYPAKNLGAFGDAGAVITDRDDVADKIRLLRDHGRIDRGQVAMWGMNSRLDNLHAAVLDVQLGFYEETVGRRRALARLYEEGLSGLRTVDLPPGPDASSDWWDVYQNYEIEADRRDELKAFLHEQGVGTLIQWSGWPVHRHPALGFATPLPRTEQLFRRCLMLPLNPFVSDDDASYVIDQVRAFYGGHA